MVLVGAGAGASAGAGGRPWRSLPSSARSTLEEVGGYIYIYIYIHIYIHIHVFIQNPPEALET